MRSAPHSRVLLLLVLLATLQATGVVRTVRAGPPDDEPEVPVLAKYATDLTGTLTPDQLASLESLLASFDRATSTQVVVLMMPTLAGADLEEYSIQVAEKNKIGRKGKDNGVLLLVARDDKKVRIEVGYGLEGVLPDALAGQIIRREIAPHFREGDYNGGLRAGAEAIMAATKDEYKAEPSSPPGGRQASPLLALFIFIVFALIRLMARRRRFFPGGPWIGGGWGSGGGFGGGSFSGGGFSGGGGSFGGGGASGGW